MIQTVEKNANVNGNGNVRNTKTLGNPIKNESN